MAGQRTAAQTPDALHRVCEKGSDADRALCIEGAIEKLSDYESALAERACRSIVGRDQEICLAPPMTACIGLPSRR